MRMAELRRLSDSMELTEAILLFRPVFTLDGNLWNGSVEPIAGSIVSPTSVPTVRRLHRVAIAAELALGGKGTMHSAES